MKKNVLFLLMMLVSTVWWQSNAQSYCTPPTISYVEPITSVVYAGINNTSSAEATAPGYEDFTSISASVVAGETHQIELQGNSGGPYTNYFTVFIDWNQNGVLDDAGEMYEVGFIFSSTGTDGQTLTGSIAAPGGALAGNTRMRIIKNYNASLTDPCGAPTFGQIEDYSVNVTIPACASPSDLAVTPTSLDAATISWTASQSSPIGYEYALTTSDTPPASGSATTNTTVEDVAIQSAVENFLHVRSNCDASGFSSWATYSFMAPTPGQIGALEVAASLPINSCNNFNYSQQLYFADELNVALEGGTNYISKIRFYYQTAPTSGTVNWNNWTVYMANTSKTEFTSTTDWVPGAELSQVFSGNLVIPTAGNWMEITLNPGFMWDGTSNLVIAVDENVSGYNCTAGFGAFNDPSEVGRTLLHSSDSVNADPAAPPTSTGWYLTVNTLQLESDVPPSCLAPIALATTGLTPNTADISWTPSGSETAWNISWGTPGYTPGDSNEISTGNSSASSYQVTGLSADTNYDIYVQADCGGNDVSIWAGPLTIYTGYCLPSSTNTSDRLSAISSNGAVTDISYSASTRPPNGYEDKTSLVFETFATQSFTMSTTYVGGNNGVNMWVDWNNDMTFETSEIVASSTGPLTQNFSIEIPAGTPEGDYRMRVRGQWNSLPPACGSVTYGSAVDFKLTLVAPPSCLPPTALAIDATTATTADISWTDNASATDYTVKYGAPGFDPETEGATASAAATGVSLSGLTANTAYQLYSKALCSRNDESEWSLPLAFRTDCDLISSLPDTENFDTYGTGAAAFPPCWTRPVTYVSGTNIWPSIVAAQSTSSPNSLRFQSLTTTPTYAVSPPFAEDINNLRVSFMLRREGPNSGTIDVGVMSDANDISTFELVQTIDPTTTTATWLEYTFDLNQVDLSGSGNFIALRHNSNASNYYYWLDDFMVQTIPTCPEPTDLAVEIVTTTTADVFWAVGGSESEWNVSWGTPGYTPGVDQLGTGAANNTPAFLITDLDANTLYEFHVQANCGVGDDSLWAGPFSFRTACGAVSAMFEDFDSYGTGNIVPECWERMAPATSAGSQTISSTSPASQPRNIWHSTGATQNSIIVALPEFSNINAGTHWLKLKARAASGGTLSVGYVTDVSDYNSFTLIEDVSITNTSYGSNSEYTVVVPNTVPAGARLGIKSAAGGGAVYWDDVSWEEVPSCLAPTALVATGATETTADIGWTAGGSESTWNISWGTPGYTPGDTEEIATDVAAVTNFQITGLTADTGYDVYVQADCNLDGESVWVGPLEVYTGYCVPTTTSDSGHIGSVTITGDLGQDISNLNSGPGLDGSGYSDFSAQTVMVTPEEDISYTVDISSGTTGLKIWIDWNNDLMFDEVTELVYQSTGYSGGFTGSITMPAGASGTHRMRIGSSYIPGGGPVNACSHDNGGEYEDYTLDIAVLATCTEAVAGTVVGSTALEVCALTPFSMSVTGNSEPADGLIRTWQSSPAGAGAWTDLDVAASTLNVAGIETATDYRYHVECINGDIDNSAIIAVSLNPDPTACYCIPEGTNSDRYINNFATTGGAQNISNLDSGYSTDGYGDFTAMTVEASAGDELSFTADIVGGTAGFRIWIDLNQDGAFDTTEEVAYSSSGYSAAHTGDFTIPFDAATGETRMRIVSHWLSSSGDADPCETGFTYGEFEDYTIDIAPFSGYIYEAGAWTPSDPNTTATASDNILVLDGTTSFTGDIEVNDITVMSGATLNVEGILTFNGDITNNGDLVFVSTANGNGELAAVNATSSITGNATVQRYMKDMRSYRMVSSAVTTSSSIHANWQEGATGVNDDPNPGFGTHITGSTTGQNGFDATATGNASMFIVDVPSQQFQAVGNTDVNTLIAGNPYLLFVRGDRGIDMNDNLAHSATVLRATGSLVTGDVTQSFTSAVSGNYIMFGNPYQSAVDLSTVFGNAGSSNLDSQFYHVYDPTIADHGAYVIVDYINGLNNNASSFANQYLQPGQGAQVQVTGPATVAFTESDKAPGNFTSSNRNPMSESNMLAVQLYTTENFNNEAQSHDAFMMFFADGYDNGIAAGDAVKSMNFYENLAIDHQGTYLGIERRAMPQAAEVYPLYTNGYNHSDYTLKLTVDGLENTFLYLDDHFTGTSLLLEAGDNAYSFSVDANQAMSVATERFSIRTEQRLGVDDNSLLAGIRLFPNPLNGDTFYINAPKLNGEQLSVNISDLTGRSIYEQTLDCRANTVTVPMGDNMASGVYLVTLKHGGESNTYRLIKE